MKICFLFCLQKWYEKVFFNQCICIKLHIQTKYIYFLYFPQQFLLKLNFNSHT